MNDEIIGICNCELCQWWRWEEKRYPDSDWIYETDTPVVEKKIVGKNVHLWHIGSRGSLGNCSREDDHEIRECQ